MKVHPKVKAFLEHAAAYEGPEPWTLDIRTQRKNHTEQLRLAEEQMVPVYEISDMNIPAGDASIRLRIYRSVPDTQLPLFLFIHGGGWCLGEIEAYEPLCRKLSSMLGCVLVHVDYRLSPENVYPAALEDVTAAAQWCFTQSEQLGIDTSISFIGGDSAGGNLAAAYCLKAAGSDLPVFDAQILIYPVTDHYSAGTESYDQYGSGYGLDREYMEYFWDRYLPAGVDLDDPLIAPLRVENVPELPETLVITAGCDPLHDEGRRYAERLEQAGTKLTYIDYEGFIHGFLSTHEFDGSHDALERIVGFLLESQPDRES
jgi:acetyl esterase